MNHYNPDLTALTEWYSAVFGLNLCTSCPSEVRKAIIQYNKMAKQKKECKYKLKEEYKNAQVSVKHYVVNATNITDETAELLIEAGLEHMLESNG